MKIELKGLKHSVFASQETHCFEASLWIDGVKRGTVRNDGHGGCNCFFPSGIEAEIQAWAKTLPDCNLGADFGTVPMSAEILISEMIDDEIERRQLKRACARKTMFREAGGKYRHGEYMTIPEKFTPATKAYIHSKWPNAIILNETI